jgi:hypothetical protein
MRTTNYNGSRSTRYLYSNLPSISITFSVLHIQERLQRGTNIYTQTRFTLLYLWFQSLSNATELDPGWTDVKFQPDCYIQTSQLKIYSPVLPSDDTQVEDTTTFPDLSAVMDELEEYMQTSHQINMTTLFADFSKLQESISIETMDVKSVQDTLKKVNIMKNLDNFNPTQLHLEKLSHLSTWTAVLFWLIAALAVVATCCCCYCLCPACCGQCITCLCTSLCKCIPLPKVPKKIANPMRAFSTNIYDTPVHY